MRSTERLVLISRRDVREASRAFQYGMVELHPSVLPPPIKRTLQLTAEGLSVREIAEKLGLSPHTIADYRKILNTVFGTNRTTHMVAVAVASGYVTVEAPQRLASMSPEEVQVAFDTGRMKDKNRLTGRERRYPQKGEIGSKGDDVANVFAAKRIA